MYPIAYVYMLTNLHHNVVYVGKTIDLRTRLWEHQTRQNPHSFTSRYNIFKPVYFEGHDTEEGALLREAYIKKKTRRWKNSLIATMNPEWKDLTEEIMNMRP